MPRYHYAFTIFFLFSAVAAATESPVRISQNIEESRVIDDEAAQESSTQPTKPTSPPEQSPPHSGNKSEVLSNTDSTPPAETISNNANIPEIIGINEEQFDEIPYSQLGLSADLLNYKKTTNSKLSTINQLNLSLYLNFIINSSLNFSGKLSIKDSGPEAHSGGDSQSGSAQVTFAYVEHELPLLFGELVVRAGNQLIPIGIANIGSELIDNYSVSPPDVETRIIPYNWNENGILLIKYNKNWSYYLGIFNSLDGSKFSTSNTERNFLIDAVQHGQNSKSQDIMLSSRIDYSTKQYSVGGSLVTGDTAQDSSQDKQKFLLAELHSSVYYNSLSLKALWTIATIDEAHNISGPTFFERARGYYITLAYDLLHGNYSFNKLPVFVHYSQYDLHEIVPINGTTDLSLNKSITTVGINYRIKSNLAYKFNYQFRNNASSNEDDLTEFGISFLY